MVIVDSYNVPEDLYYTRDHAWVRIEGHQIRIERIQKNGR
jgi:glycine cleavage system H protein